MPSYHSNTPLTPTYVRSAMIDWMIDSWWLLLSLDIPASSVCTRWPVATQSHLSHHRSRRAPLLLLNLRTSTSQSLVVSMAQQWRLSMHGPITQIISRTGKPGLLLQVSTSNHYNLRHIMHIQSNKSSSSSLNNPLTCSFFVSYCRQCREVGEISGLNSYHFVSSVNSLH